MPYYKKHIKKKLDLIEKEIKKNIYKRVNTLSAEAWVTSEPVGFDERNSGRYKKVEIGDKWGEIWDCAWFNFKGKVQMDSKGKKVVLLIDVSGEACLFDDNGCPVRGLTNMTSGFEYSLGRPGKRVLQFAEESNGGEDIDIWIEAGCNDLFGESKNNGVLQEAYIAECCEDMRQLYYDFHVLLNLMYNLDEESARANSILFCLNEASNILSKYTREEALLAREIIKKELSKRGGDPSLSISAIGHAHIDLAWLWPIRETIRKGGRTFATVLELMERYPDYMFGASQPQLYQWMKDAYPSLYMKISQKIAEGRWEAQGAMWVEADTNISGGEALVRQLLYGKRFFKNEFNKEMRILWLPDVFGYSAALPQILKKSGVDYFMTQKLSWSEHNKFPHHTFIWQGIDGTGVLAHLASEDTYNSPASPWSIKRLEKNYSEKGICEEALMLFGIGDGGGGPGPEHLERLMREKNLDGLCPVQQEKSIDFFDRISKMSSRYPSWVGELYLEKHQGTYTTQSRNKWFNRKMEINLRELEFVSIINNILTGATYHQNDIEEIWKEVLLYQFHDILPGSSIKRVYDESVERYQILYDKTEMMINNTYKNLATGVDTELYIDPIIVTNSLSWERVEWIKYNEKWIRAELPAMGYVVMDSANITEMKYNVFVEKLLMENNFLSVKFDSDGSISSIFDKQYSKELIINGSKGNKLAVYHDAGDAWDIPIYYDECNPEEFKLERVEAFNDGPKGIIKQYYSYGQSKIIQEISLTDNSRRLDFNTSVDWNENNKMLRTSFPVDINTESVTCNIQYGSIKRSTHSNTTWDLAKYEICAQKWVDLSQGDYGVALLNDCKYGHKIKGKVIDLNLLRSPNYPGVDADKGKHNFIYSLFPHIGCEYEGQVDRRAYELNTPVRIISSHRGKGNLKNNFSLIEISEPNIILESIKKAEDDADIILRLYENSGRGCKTKIKFNTEVKRVNHVDMMELNGETIKSNDNSVNLYFKPFEIHTLKVSRQ